MALKTKTTINFNGVPFPFDPRNMQDLNLAKVVTISNRRGIIYQLYYHNPKNRGESLAIIEIRKDLDQHANRFLTKYIYTNISDCTALYLPNNDEPYLRIPVCTGWTSATHDSPSEPCEADYDVPISEVFQFLADQADSLDEGQGITEEELEKFDNMGSNYDVKFILDMLEKYFEIATEAANKYADDNDYWSEKYRDEYCDDGYDGD